ncbi:MAG: hypothetical protein ACM33T_16830 [Solirubrobacterales bacterium]
MLRQLHEDFRTQVMIDNARAIAEALMQHQAQLADQQERSTKAAMWAAVAASVAAIVAAAATVAQAYLAWVEFATKVAG